MIEFPLTDTKLVDQLKFDTIYEGSFQALPMTVVNGPELDLDDPAYGQFAYIKFYY